ncbi:MAG: EAL domain-containing protein, partial [Gammaproteobacteria bacterium]
DGELLHIELFLRLIDLERDGAVIPAGIFVPMAESLGLASRIDRWVITEVAERLGPALGEARLAINMSSSSLVEEGFLDWLAEYLARHPGLAGRLILEWSEYGAVAHRHQLKDWIERLTPLGVEFSLDHFGKGFSSFAAIRELKLHYLKVDGSFTRSVQENPDDGFFLQVVADIAHGLEMMVIAESVEDPSTWQRLRGLGVDGGRGYHLGRPSDVRA